MPRKQLHRVSGGTSKMPVDSAILIESGDMVFNNTNDLRAATDFAYVTADLPRTQANFAAKFVGVASGSSEAGDTRDVTFRQCGVFEFECASATFEKGDLVGPDDNAAPDALLNQQVIAIGENGFGAIGRVHIRYGVATTRVKVEIFQPSFSSVPMTLSLGTHVLGTADELLTNLDLGWPVKLVRLVSNVTIVMTGAGAEVLSLEKNATALDDTLSMTIGAAVGVVDEQELIDATGDDIILAGDTITLVTDGGSDGGSAHIWVVYRPFVMQVA